MILKYSTENFKEIANFCGKRSGKDCTYDYNKAFFQKNNWNIVDDLKLIIGADLFSKRWNVISKIIFDYK